MTMDMSQEALQQRIEDGIEQRYSQFQGLINGEEFRPFRNLCMEMASNRELLGHVVFCNDLFHIPPVKTFLLYYSQRLQPLVDSSLQGLSEETAEDKTRMLKRSLGAFWGAVFKGALGYQESKTVTVTLSSPLVVSTASYFIKGHEGQKGQPPATPSPRHCQP